MKVVFNLEYQTTFGEELMLNIIAEGKTEQHQMGTFDGLHWTCELSKTVKASAHIDYFYSVVRGDQQTRHEWLVTPHRLEFAAKKGSRYIRRLLYVLFCIHRMRSCQKTSDESIDRICQDCQTEGSCPTITQQRTTCHYREWRDTRQLGV